MHLKKITIENIRCFERLEIDLTTEDGKSNWLVLLGDNSVGKTTILRSIALGLGDRDYASTLLRDQPIFWVRREAEDGLGKIWLEFDEWSGEQNVYIKIKNEGDREVLQAFDPPESPSFSKIFACGYGAARSAFATSTYDRYRTIDSIYSLFDYSTPLQNPELMIRRLETDGGYNREDLMELLDDLLMLEPGSTQMGRSGLEISGPWGKAIQVAALGDGYQSIVNLVADYIGWGMFFYDETQKFEDLNGIVIIDEIEQHLHPKWQRSVIDRLRKRFPNTQFICTTHSPLTAAGTANLNDDAYKLWLLSNIEGSSAVSGSQYPPLRGLRADQILTSRAFGLSDSRDTRAEDLLDDFRALLLEDNPTEEQKIEIETLRSKIENQIPGLAETEEERILNKQLTSYILKHSYVFDLFRPDLISETQNLPDNLQITDETNKGKESDD